jgi:carboxypeptidase T
MRYILVLIPLAILTAFSAATADDVPRADDFLIVRIAPGPEGIRGLAPFGVDVCGTTITKEGDLRVVLSKDELGNLRAAGYAVDVEGTYLEVYGPSSIETFGNGYRTFAEVVAELNALHAAHPGILSAPDSVGRSYEGRAIWAVQLTDNPGVNEGEPGVLLTGLHHAREPVSMEAIMYYLNYMVDNYGTDPEVTYLVNSREIWFIPVVNPDGYVFNEVNWDPGNPPMQRKTMRPPDGVDPNRNYSYYWGYDNIGSSGNQYSETYRGPYAFSEYETQATRDFVLSHENLLAVDNYHTYSNFVLYPFGYEDPPLYPDPPDSQYHVNTAMDMVAYNGYMPGTAPGILYPTNGDANDYMYGHVEDSVMAREGLISFTTEIGSSSDGFWPSQSRIIPLCEENLGPNLVLTWLVGPWPDVISTVIDDVGGNNNGQADPGEQVSIVLTVRNKGLSTITGLTAAISTDDPFVSSIDDGSTSFGDLSTYQEADNSGDPFLFTTYWFTPEGWKVPVDVTFTDAGGLSKTVTVRIPVGTSAVVEDWTFEANNGGFTQSGGGWAWGTPSSGPYGAHSGTKLWATNLSGNYGSSADWRLESPQIDLTAVSLAELTFWHWYDFETPNWDGGNVKISVSGGAFQLITPEDGYDGVVDSYNGVIGGEQAFIGNGMSWRQETFDLSPYAGNNVRIRWHFGSDSYVTEDGWYVDDVQVVAPDPLYDPSLSVASYAIDDAGGNGALDPGESAYLSVELHNAGPGPAMQNDLTLTSPTGDVVVTDAGGYIAAIAPDSNESTDAHEFELNALGSATPGDTVDLGLAVSSYNGYSANLTVRIIIGDIVNAPGSETLPTSYALHPARPNPFNPTTTVSFDLPEAASVRLEAFDVLGRLVATLADGEFAAGTHDVRFDAGSLPSGVYFVRMSAGDFMSVKKAALIR